MMKSPIASFSRGLWVAVSLASIGGGAHAEMARVVEDAGVVLRRLEPQGDGSIAVIANTAVTRVVPGAGNGPWKTGRIAVVPAARRDSEIYVAAWNEQGRWWLLRDDVQDGSHVIWNHVLVGPVVARGYGPAPPPVFKTLSKRGTSWDRRTLAFARAADAWAGVIADGDHDPGVLRRFDAHGRDDPEFSGNAARAVGSATVSDVIAGESAGWFVATLGDPLAHAPAAVMSLGQDGNARAAFGQDGRVSLPPGAAIQALHADADGRLWILGWDRDAAQSRPWLKAWSASGGERHAELDGGDDLLKSIWPSAALEKGSWVGFVRNAAAPTVCAAIRPRRSVPASLRCVSRSVDGWHSLGEAQALPNLELRDVIVDPLDPHRMILGVDDGQGKAMLFIWTPQH